MPTLTRTGRRPLEFDGELIHEDHSHTLDGPGQTRYWSLAIYRLADGRHVLGLSYHTQWDGEHPTHHAEVFTDLDALFAHLEAHDPLAPVRGYPDSERFQARQRELERAITAAWREMVADTAAALGVVERL